MWSKSLWQVWHSKEADTFSGSDTNKFLSSVLSIYITDSRVGTTKEPDKRKEDKEYHVWASFKSRIIEVLKSKKRKSDQPNLGTTPLTISKSITPLIIVF